MNMPGTKTKLAFICFGLFLILMPGCKEKPKNPVAEYGDSLVGAYKGSQNAAEQANLDAVQKAINAYHAANEGYPKSLQDVEQLIGSPIDLTKYNYDPATGTATLKPKQ